MRTLRSRPTPPALRIPPDLKYSGKVGSKRTKLSPVAMATAKPLRMRAWMENLLNNNECKGLSWVNREDKTFEIMWCHASRHDFDTKEHADVFIKYAEFTGRTNIVDDGTNVYNSKLKSNFRSALHSLVDCIPVKEELIAVGAGKAKGENKVKVYQFIDPTHPEYKRKRLQKINSQRRLKKNGASKSKNIKSETQIPDADQEVKQEEEEEDVTSQTPPPQSPLPGNLPMDLVSQDSGFLLTDEAARFIANNEEKIQHHHHQQQQQQQQQLLQQVDIATTTATMMVMMSSSPTAMAAAMSTTTSDSAIPQILIASDPHYTLTDISQSSPVTTYSSSPFRHASDDDTNQPAYTFTTTAAPTESTASHNYEYDENQKTTTSCVPLEFEGVDCSALESETDNIPPPLPNFIELGVDDTFATPVTHASQNLKSGGTVHVRKEKQSFPQPIITLLRNVELPVPMSGRQTDSVHQPHHQEYQGFDFLIEEEGFGGEPRNSFTGPGGFGRIIEQTDAVTVVLQDAKTISQGGDYNLLNVGSTMDYTT